MPFPLRSSLEFSPVKKLPFSSARNRLFPLADKDNPALGKSFKFTEAMPLLITFWTTSYRRDDSPIRPVKISVMLLVAG